MRYHPQTTICSPPNSCPKPSAQPSSSGLSWFAFQTPTFTQTPAAPELPIAKVAQDLYEIEGDGGNVAVLVTAEGVIHVDDKYDYDQIAAKIRSFTTHYLPTIPAATPNTSPLPTSSPPSTPATASSATNNPTNNPAWPPPTAFLIRR